MKSLTFVRHLFLEKKRLFLSMGVTVLLLGVFATALAINLSGTQAASWPTVKEGSKDTEVVYTIHYLLEYHKFGDEITPTGKFGPKTKAAVIAFQKAKGIKPANGTVGADTWLKLIKELKKGDEGNHVRALQRQLSEAGAVITVDGIFGPETEAAVNGFKTAVGLAEDGIAGVKTWLYLVSSDAPEYPVPTEEATEDEEDSTCIVVSTPIEDDDDDNMIEGQPSGDYTSIFGVGDDVIISNDDSSTCMEEDTGTTNTGTDETDDEDTDTAETDTDETDDEDTDTAETDTDETDTDETDDEDTDTDETENESNTGTLTHEQAVKKLNEVGIAVVSLQAKCSESGNNPCTSLKNIRSVTVDGVIAFQKASKCAIIITGGTEDSAAEKENGYKIEILSTECVTAYISKNLTNKGKNGDTTLQYMDENGTTTESDDDSYIRQNGSGVWTVTYH